MWIVSDTHFFHENVIEYTGRPFKTVEEMNETMIDNWNAVIGEEDTIYHLGDFAMGKENVKHLVERLNGNIILIQGNHDRSGKAWFKEQGFKEVYNELLIGNILLTHRPKRKGRPEGVINLHGHMHNIDSGLDPKWYRNCSVEKTNYTPFWFKIEEENTNG